ncbi:efflux RND transporter periplasmic adaptor subunit [Pelagicoccus sp. SDUM812002]|uniref:efflux RND transporter periplasmic adaptor subunit n=1 Tax=Pelagicoccus sp. SDUM812002 TaxID=3041266 RepID=UPI00280FC265|nr:efflux RND transporter periplasmic adaptor subunit [Pelagicoccus sp. SDUM812002]MDQ8186252.1 efflux RND transporter periplasmic adaptor subunit [Pelagicoccus sp. SDUM812002]
MKHHIPFSALFLFSSAFLAGCGSQETADSATRQRPAPSVTVTEIKSEEIVITRELPGRASPFLIAEVRPQVDGIVEQRLFTEGALVTEDQALYQLDDARYQANYEVAKASLENAQSALKLARSEANRSKDLFQSKAISAQEYDGSQATLQQAEAQAKLAAASLASSEITLDYSRIASPISGRIGKSSVTKGALVTANQPTPLATVQQLDPIYVDLTQSSSELLAFRRAIANGELQATDLPVKLILEDGTEYQHPGKFSFSEVSVDPSTGTYTLRVETPNPDHVLLPGMYVRGIISEGLRPDGILVPQKAVNRQFDGSTAVMVVGADNKVESRPVQLGRTIGHKWIVESGLKPGDRVVINGLQKAPAGTAVKISGTESSEG